jgi:hypothetical protein
LISGAALILTVANAEDCKDVREQCNQIISAFEKEIELKDLMIQEQKAVIRMVEDQRDMAYDLAEYNPNLFNKVLLGVAGVGVGCAAMAEKTEVRLICLASGMLACAFGGC